MNQPKNNFSFPYITGDGIGQDITPATQKIVNAAWQKIYGDQTKVEWIKLFAWKESIFRSGTWLPKETIDAIAHYGLAIKWPMGTPIGTGTRSFNVAMRKELDLYACIRPIKYYDGVPTMHIAPWWIDAVIFRENVEDIYSGKELRAEEKETMEFIAYMNDRFGWDLDITSAIGIKNISKKNSQRLIKAAADYAEKYNYDKLTLMHKGNIMKFTEGAFMNRWYDLIKDDYSSFITSEQERILQNNEAWLTHLQNAQTIDRGTYEYRTAPEQLKIIDKVKATIAELREDGKSWKEKKVIDAMIGDNTLQQTILNPRRFGVIATTNLNGDYLSDNFAAVIGWLGVAPGVNINFETGVLLAEATHGTADDLPRDKANLLSHTLSAKLALALKGHQEVADIIENAVAKQLLSRRVTSDLVRTATQIHDKVKEQAAKGVTPGIRYLRKYTKAQKKWLILIGTNQFAEEVCEKILQDDQDAKNSRFPEWENLVF